MNVQKVNALNMSFKFKNPLPHSKTFKLITVCRNQERRTSSLSLSLFLCFQDISINNFMNLFSFLMYFYIIS